MSIHHLETAAELELHATSKLVLMALADDANKITRITFPGREKLVQWSGAKPRRVQAIIEELIEAGYLLRRKAGQPGRKAEFLIFPTEEEIAAQKSRRRPAETTASGGAVGCTHVGAAECTHEPVDNHDPMGAVGCTHENDNGCINRHNGCTPECTPPLRPKPFKDLTQSSGPTHLTGPVENTDDDRVSHPPTRRAATSDRRTLDTAVLSAAVAQVLAVTGIDDEQLGQLGGIILARSKYVVTDPTSYVIAAIRADPFEWQSRAFELVASADDLGGNRF